MSSDFLSERDGFAADSRNIFLTNGASDGVRLCMQTIMRNPQSGFQDGVLTPIPQYPLYSALITLLNGSFVAYHLDEVISDLYVASNTLYNCLLQFHAI